MIKFYLYSDESKRKEIDALRNELYGNHFTDRERESFETVLDCLWRYSGEESYSKCKNSYRNLLSYSHNQQVKGLMSEISKLIGRHAEFKRNWQWTLIDNPQLA